MKYSIIKSSLWIENERKRENVCKKDICRIRERGWKRVRKIERKDRE